MQSLPAGAKVSQDLTQQAGPGGGDIQALAGQITETEAALNVHRETQTRLIKEQRDKQRQLDKLEAQAQAIQESQGTRRHPNAAG